MNAEARVGNDQPRLRVRRCFTCCIAALFVAGCVTHERNLVVTEDYFARQPCLTPHEIAARNELLRSIRVNMSDDVPLKLLPIISHLNRRLKEEGVPFRVVGYWNPETEPRNSLSRQGVLDLLPKEKDLSPLTFKGATDADLRREINEGSIYECLYKMRDAYMFTPLYYRDCIVVNWTIATTPCVQY